MPKGGISSEGRSELEEKMRAFNPDSTKMFSSQTSTADSKMPIRSRDLSKSDDSEEQMKQRLKQNLAPKLPVYVMLPLDTVLIDDYTNQQILNLDSRNFQQLKKAGAEGVMVDVWWGFCERRPKSYDFTGYLRLIEQVAQSGLKLQVVTSFHKCGGNVGDALSVPLPDWVLEVGKLNPDIFYTDSDGNHNDEYLSLGVDCEPIFPPFSTLAYISPDQQSSSTDSLPPSPLSTPDQSPTSPTPSSPVSSSASSSSNPPSPLSASRPGRTALRVYEDFLEAFANTFRPYFGSVLTQVQVSLGPAGELRYPSYPLALGWEFPGIGQMQCYDRYMLQLLASAADDIGRPEWGVPPLGLGSYNDKPSETRFFDETDGYWKTDHGHFFLTWYSNALIQHGDRVLSTAYRILSGTRTNGPYVVSKRASAPINSVSIAAKVAGVHWWYRTQSHAAELTAGYYNTANHDGYKAIAQMLAKYDAHFDFTCLEMRNCESNHEWQCAPEDLVWQTAKVAAEAGCEFAGENALNRFDDYAYRQMVYACYRTNAIALTYLRMCPDLFIPENLARFSRFCRVSRTLSKDWVQLMLLEWFTGEDGDEEVSASEEKPTTSLSKSIPEIAHPQCKCDVCLCSSARVGSGLP
mmetsp:Transcript_27371/g.44557  ORF Transcript_27371/g.44557 Transcript_27371/m.44557 type:complete len:633 (+) Transcript_27371:1299-3197(+)|eukprot:CAMPEP_0184654608 /NCGR_PEP_ID=MMETSP0308-20130426/12274_1 /TAXON_ID=38269 /ORGANISM="Gloeochaete witrockiana, Strain SAG 46.84" /LENGTH=632 /DNA_ID=CAMNT_0027090673 /DNA_START=1237 /DNA_END=3135 /DNA_ORIENTATION=+